MHTVKEVAELSRVSVRTLRFYDEIGLLKPAYIGDNGYRYYDKPQLLALQQILFYRELGFELAVIQKILADPGFDRAEALRSHREKLIKESDRTATLIRTIDQTLAHLEGEVPMKEAEMYLGFDPEKQAAHEREVIERWGEPASEHVEESRRRTKNWKKADYDQVKKDYEDLHREFTAALLRGAPVEDSDVQNLVGSHFAVINRFWTPSRESYIGLGAMYCDHPEFRKLYDSYHPRLAEYLAEAMRVYAMRVLS